jgi:hypothetical protein
MTLCSRNREGHEDRYFQSVDDLMGGFADKWNDVTFQDLRTDLGVMRMNWSIWVIQQVGRYYSK